MSSLAALDLNLLLVLHTVLAERSVARAAKKLHVTPSAISNALARLRGVLADPLIARSGRGIVPTPRALALAPVLARTLDELAEAVHGSSDPAATTRTFTLAVADSGQIVRVPRLAAAMATRLPRAKLRVVGIDSLVSLGGLAGSEVDVAIGPGERGPGIHVEPLYDEHVVLIARASHPARLGSAALAACRHVAIEMAPGRNFRDLTGAAYAKAGIAREVVLSVPTFTAAAAVVAATDLIASVPRSLVDVLGVGIRIVGTPLPPLVVPMHLAWHERTDADAAMALFRGLVRDATALSGTPLPGRGRRRSPSTYRRTRARARDTRARAPRSRRSCRR